MKKNQILDFKFDGLKVLITGGSRGIGKSCVDLFESNGAKVTAPSREVLDLSKKEKIKLTVNELGKFDILILNAGINEIQDFEDIDENELMKLLQVNSFANLTIIKENLNYMISNQWGRILFLSSIFEKRAKKGRAMYSMSKAMNGAIVRNLALEYGSHGILSNSIAPGFVMTDLTKKNNNDQQIKKIKDSIPLNRLAETEEIAITCMFLTSTLNTYINGQNLIVDGGYSCS